LFFVEFFAENLKRFPQIFKNIKGYIYKNLGKTEFKKK